ncbi:MAG: glycine--tRNA ligase [Erysipelotrichales bacterium]|nr:glycine--tRNA ligase [Erysipelotrichales bacterium]
MMAEYSIEKIVNHLKTTGFVYQGSEIYGGLSNTWDFGPLGVALKDNIKRAWQKKFIQEQPNNVEIQSAILMNPEVWVATGHVANFSDPLIDCKQCHARLRADNMIEEFSKGTVNPEGWTNEEMMNYIRENNVPCPSCGGHDFTDIRKFNLMFKTFQGVLEDTKSTIYLRPETAQGMFVNFKNVQRTMRLKLPFGICQIGKSFRNEITPGNFIFRTREFEQMEMEFFCKPGTDLEWYEYWKKYMIDFLHGLGMKEENMRLHEHSDEERAFYSVATVDIQYKFPFGWGELWGLADRTDYDLKRHQNHSKQSLEYLDPFTNEKFVPYCVEPAVGVERLFLAFVCGAYDEETLEGGDTRIVLHLRPVLAPIKCAVLPLVKKLNEPATEIYHKLMKEFHCTYDETGAIGKRYRRQDMIGTPYCVTVDFDTLEDGCVTVRERDSMEQKRVKIEEVADLIRPSLDF